MLQPIGFCLSPGRKQTCPKLYFTDTGLLAHLLRYPDAATMQKGPMAGAFFESFIVIEALKHKLNDNAKVELYFLRDSNRNEVDLILESTHQHHLLEIKLSKTPRYRFAEPIKRLRPVFEKTQGTVLCFAGEHYALEKGIKIAPWTYIYELLGGITD